MTLVGCFTSQQTPILIGDFLITGQGEYEGLRKKIRRVGANVVVGWTGNLLAAEAALEHLGRKLGHHSSLGQIEVALRGIDVTSMPGAVTLVGWVVDGDNTAFHWQSTYPVNVNLGGPWYVGSGGQLLEAMRGPRGYPELEGEDPRLHALDIATSLMSEEARGKSLRQLQIGHAYELLWWTGSRFDYVDDILYLTVRVEYEGSGSVKKVRPLEPIFKYFTHNELSFVGIFENDEVHLHAISPVGLRESGKNDSSAALSLLKKLVADDWAAQTSTFCCAGLDFRIPGYMGPILPLVLENSSQPTPPIIKESAQSVEIRLPDDLLVQMYQDVLKDQAGDGGV